eukprot:6837536-Prymnesium_polylepis.1
MLVAQRQRQRGIDASKPLKLEERREGGHAILQGWAKVKSSASDSLAGNEVLMYVRLHEGGATDGCGFIEWSFNIGGRREGILYTGRTALRRPRLGSNLPESVVILDGYTSNPATVGSLEIDVRTTDNKRTLLTFMGMHMCFALPHGVQKKSFYTSTEEVALTHGQDTQLARPVCFFDQVEVAVLSGKSEPSFVRRWRSAPLLRAKEVNW